MQSIGLNILNVLSLRSLCWPKPASMVHKMSTLQFITKTRLFKYTEIFTTKIWKFSDEKSDNFHISAENIDCGYPLEPSRRGGSNGYPQSMFLSRNKENNVYPCKPQFYYIKVGQSGVWGDQSYIGMFSWWVSFLCVCSLNSMDTPHRI